MKRSTYDKSKPRVSAISFDEEELKNIIKKIDKLSEKDIELLCMLNETKKENICKINK